MNCQIGRTLFVKVRLPVKRPYCQTSHLLSLHNPYDPSEMIFKCNAIAPDLCSMLFLHTATQSSISIALSSDGIFHNGNLNRAKSCNKYRRVLCAPTALMDTRNYCLRTLLRYRIDTSHSENQRATHITVHSCVELISSMHSEKTIALHSWSSSIVTRTMDRDLYHGLLLTGGQNFPHLRLSPKF